MGQAAGRKKGRQHLRHRVEGVAHLPCFGKRGLYIGLLSSASRLTGSTFAINQGWRGGKPGQSAFLITSPVRGEVWLAIGGETST